MTAGMMIAISGFILAVTIILALLVWTPWNDGSGRTTIDNRNNNPVPSQPANPGGNNSGGGAGGGSGGSNTLLR
jgi:hypothetical protein